MTAMLRNVSIAVALLALLGAGLVWYARQANGRPGPPQQTLNSAQSGSTAKPPTAALPAKATGGEIVQKDAAGQVLWRLKAKGSITGSKESGSLQADDITFETAGGQAGKAWTAKAPSASVSYGSKRIVFPRGVEARAKDGSLSFTADRAQYQMDTRKIVGQGEVKATFPAGTAQADRVTVDTVRGEVRFHGIKGSYSF
jgi:LPS export ABC transporter protein LptC